MFHSSNFLWGLLQETRTPYLETEFGDTSPRTYAFHFSKVKAKLLRLTLSSLWQGSLRLLNSCLRSCTPGLWSSTLHVAPRALGREGSGAH